jgi:hypothetical protein
MILQADIAECPIPKQYQLDRKADKNRPGMIPSRSATARARPSEDSWLLGTRADHCRLVTRIQTKDLTCFVGKCHILLIISDSCMVTAYRYVASFSSRDRPEYTATRPIWAIWSGALPKVPGTVAMYHDLDRNSSSDFLGAERIGIPIVICCSSTVFTMWWLASYGE